MEASLFKDINDQLAGLKPFQFETPANPLTGEVQKTQEVNRAIRFGELLRYSITNRESHDAIERYGLADMYNTIRSTDVSALLAADTHAVMANLSNKDTVTYDLLRSAREPLKVKDWQQNTLEERASQLRAPAFNPDGDNPAEDQDLRTVKQNSLMFVGTQLREGIVTGDMVQQQQGMSIMGRELTSAALKIKQAASYYSLRGVRQANFSYQNIPQCDGIYTDAVLNIKDCSALDVSGANIVEVLEGIASYIGWGFNVIALTNNKTMEVIENLEIGKWGLSRPSDQRKEYMEMMPAELQKMNISFNKWYVPANGNPVPFIYEKDLPTGTTLLFVYGKVDAEQCLCEFELAGKAGMWALAREVETLVKMVVAFYGFSTRLPLSELKGKLFNHT